MNFLQQYDDQIIFEWNSYGGDDIEWDYGWNNLGRKKLPTSINNLVIDICENNSEPLFEDVYSETESYQLRATFFTKEKKVLLTVLVEEYITEDHYYEENLSEDSEALKYMGENNITLISCDYSGGGDSGEIGSIMVNGKPDDILAWERDTNKLKVIDEIYSFLNKAYGGWEIDDGSSGTIQLNDKGSLSISHSWSSREWFDSGEEIILTIEDFN